MISTLEPTEAAEPAAAPVTSGRQTRFYNIPGDTVYKATADLPDDQRNPLRWLHHYGHDNNVSYKDLGALLKKPDGSTYDGNTVYKVLTGVHQAKLDNIAASAASLQKIIEERGTITRLDFIETNLTRRIFQICDAALVYQQIAFIIGKSHTGKTTALLEYQRTHNHGQTIYFRMPEGGGIHHVLGKLAHVLKISAQAYDLRARIIDSFDDRMCLLVDEAHQPFVSQRGPQRIRSLEFLRELFDEAKCGMVICATEVFDYELTQGSHRKLLEQFGRRSLFTHRLPDRPSKADLQLIAKHYGLAPATGEAADLQTAMIRDHGLGKWCIILRAASRLAGKNKQRLTWTHVLNAHTAIQQLEQKD